MTPVSRVLVSALVPAGLVLLAPAADAGSTAAAQRGVAEAMIVQQQAQSLLSDARIRSDITKLWYKQSKDLYAQINLKVQQGRVLLTGLVPDPQARVDAVRLAWQVEGVREVINEISVTDDSSLADAARDSWIATKLRARLTADGSLALNSLNYSIEVVNKTIYLIGVAQDQAELDRVVAHAKDISYVRRLVNYVRVKGDPAPAS